MTLALERTGPKPPPEKPEAEASLLGSILIDAHVYEETVRGRIAPAELSREPHRLVLGAIERVWERGEPLGFQSVQADLAARGELDTVGGAQFLVGLMQNVPTVAHAETYATIVERTALLRRLIGAANEIAHLALTREDAKSAVVDAQELLFAVSESNLHRDVVPLDIALRRFADQISARADDHHEGLPTGFASLDAKTGGLQRSDLILLAGRPGLGKTSFALNIVWNAAAAGKTCAIFSLEMSEMQVVQRLISMTSEIDGNRMRRGRLSPQEFVSISDASDRLQKAPIYVEESSQLTVTDILAKSRRLQAERGLDLLVIDYLQLIEGAGDDESRVLEVARISRSLKAIARELQVPVLALSQLSRQIETRGTEPMLSDLRECVTGDTRVIDATSGHWVPVRSIRPGTRIVAVDARQRTGIFEVADVWSTGRKPVYKVTSQSGRVIRATANHPFLTSQGWRPLAELGESDLLIATAMRLPDHGTERDERGDLCRLLGYLVGDGTYRKWGAVGFISSDPATFDDVVDVVTRRFAGVTPRVKRHTEGYREVEFRRLYDNGYGKPYGNPLREWLRELGLHGQTDERKRVPDFVFGAGVAGVAEFIAGYLASDGCVKSREVPHKRRRWSIQFDTVNPLLAEDIQALLLRLGVTATIRPGAWNTKSTQPIYRIDVHQTWVNLARFARLVPVRGRKAALLQELLADQPIHETSPGVYSLPAELSVHLKRLQPGWKDQHKRMRRSTALAWAERTDDELLRVHAEGDLLWERIRSVVPEGEDEVFDLRVPGSGNFLANGFVVHNSGALEADADLVMFLWQKDRKDRDESVVRLKLAKHRNGPTGDFDLHFQSELTRFRDLGETRAEV